MSEAKRSVQLDPQRMVLAETARNDWVVTAAPGTTVDDVLKPAFWAHKAREMTPYDRIEVREETGEWMLELMVLSQGLNWATVHVLQHHVLQHVAEEPEGVKLHKLQWRGPRAKWGVIRLSDNQVLQDGMDKDQAAAWMAQHERVTTVT